MTGTGTLLLNLNVLFCKYRRIEIGVKEGMVDWQWILKKKIKKQKKKRVSSTTYIQNSLFCLFKIIVVLVNQLKDQILVPNSDLVTNIDQLVNLIVVHPIGEKHQRFSEGRRLVGALALYLE